MTSIDHSVNSPPSANALLEMGTQLPPFDRFSPDLVTDAVDQLIAAASLEIEKATNPDAGLSWAQFVAPIEAVTERLGRVWGMVGHLNGVADSPELRVAYTSNLGKITQFWTGLAQNLALYNKYKALKISDQWETLSAAQKRTIDNSLRNFKLGGAELTGAARERFAAIADEQAELQQKFSEHVLDATNAFELIITDATRLKGLPEDALSAARGSAEGAGKLDSNNTGWRFTLQHPSYFPIMQYADDRLLRETIYRANVVRASELAPADQQALNNTPVIAQLMALRQEEAELLGYNNYAEVSLVPKMAESPAQVDAFLLDLSGKAKPSAQRDLDELHAFAKAQGFGDIEAWDLPYLSEKLKSERYSFSDSEVKQYFTVDRVLSGLFGLIERLFNVVITADQTSTWHSTVRFYKIERAGKLIGQFYLDLYARDSKRPGAWMDDARARKAVGLAIQTPVAYLTCNFQAPYSVDPAKPEVKASLLTHDDVITLFHEFGHGLHHMLTQVDEIAVSGISGVEWDAVELPSQFMENFCWDWSIVESMTCHVASGQAMPKALFDKMMAAKNFQSGLQTLRQVEFSLFDIRLHRDWKSSSKNPQDILNAVRQEVALLTPPAFNRFQNSFSHIFGGGYAAGYYSYKWAEVLSADCYAAFEEVGPEKQAEIGVKFLTEILEMGGSRPAIDSFRAFRGRDPQIDALLRHNGMESVPA